MTAKELCKHLVGMKFDMADYAMWAMNRHYRIMYDDDMTFVQTRDYKPDRINIGIRDDIIVEAKIG